MTNNTIFKIGDKVILKEGVVAGTSYNRITLLDNMVLERPAVILGIEYSTIILNNGFRYSDQMLTKCEFKVGDKVKVIHSEGFNYCNIDEVGIIEEIDLNLYFPVTVNFRGGKSDCGYISDLELVSSSTREYLIEDVIRLMRENPERKFKTDTISNSYIEYDVSRNSIRWKGGAVRTLEDINLTWTEYFPEKPIKPIKFSQVIEVTSMYGNDVMVQLDTENHIYMDYLDDLLRELSIDTGTTSISEYIQDGEWYLISPFNDKKINYDLINLTHKDTSSLRG